MMIFNPPNSGWWVNNKFKIIFIKKFFFCSFLFAANFFIECILITRFGNKPIDDIVLTWSSNSPPDNWTELRDKWWSLHIMRTIAELAALFLVTWTSVKKV